MQCRLKELRAHGKALPQRSMKGIRFLEEHCIWKGVTRFGNRKVYGTTPVQVAIVINQDSQSIGKQVRYKEIIGKTMDELRDFEIAYEWIQPRVTTTKVVGCWLYIHT